MEKVTLSRVTYDHLVEQANVLKELQAGDKVLKIYINDQYRPARSTCSKEDAKKLVEESLVATAEYWKADAQFHRAEAQKAKQRWEELAEAKRKSEKSHKKAMDKLLGLVAASWVLTAGGFLL